MHRKARALIDLNAIQSNYRLARLTHPKSQCVAIVKADAYGHGAVRVATQLDNEVDAFGVTCIDEAITLREAGIKKPVLLLEGFFDHRELPLISSNNFWITVHSEFQISQLEKTSVENSLTIWLKLDSGMHRLGISPENYVTAYNRLNRLPQVNNVVLMSHFSCADELDNPTTTNELNIFKQATKGIDARVSLSNSPAILGWLTPPGEIRRPGLMLYGASPFRTKHPNVSGLIPAMTLLSEVIAIRRINAGESVGYGAGWTATAPTIVGTVAMGYGDGYPRYSENGTPAFVRGVRTRIIGRVSMDMLSIDLTHVSGADIGTEVEFFGKNLSINEVASWSSTIPHTLMTGLTTRVPRYYGQD